MSRLFRSLFFFLAVAANGAASAASAADAADATITEKFICTFSVTDPAGAPLAARLFLSDAGGNNLPPPPTGEPFNGEPFYLLDGNRQIPLAAGQYVALFDAGPRRVKAKLRLQVGANSNHHFQLALDRFHWDDRAGWAMLNPFFDHAGFSSRNQLRALVRSAGLRVCGLAAPPFFIDEVADRADFFNVVRGDGWTVIGNAPSPAASAVGARLALARDAGAITVFNGRENAERLFELAAGGIYDALDITRGGDDYAFWQAWLGLGRRLPALAGGGTGLSMYARTIVQPPARADYLAALRAGRTQISNGPFVRFYVADAADGQNVAVEIGETVPTADAPRAIVAEAFAGSDPADSIGRVELLYNGKIVESTKIGQEQKSARVRWSNVQLRTPGWLQARYLSTAPDLWAVTNPIYVGVAPPATGLTTKLSLTIKGGRGRLTAENFGAPLIERAVKDNETLTLTLPATATLTMHFAGRPPKRVSLYELSGAKNYCERAVKMATTRPRDWLTGLQKLLQEVEAEITSD
ncbi:hypothetical protein FACS1894108_02250 [Planctomycetales bacterium]|nr:hypothetical protein FACS1894108_02250 [Planctomycetales bacterium]